MLNKSCQSLPYNIAFVCEGGVVGARGEGASGERGDGAFGARGNGLSERQEGDFGEKRRGAFGEMRVGGESGEKRKEVVIGHSRLSCVVGQPNCAFVESGWFYLFFLITYTFNFK